MNFPELLANKTDTNLIIIVDEFQKITQVSKDIIPLFRSVLQTQGRTNYVAAGFSYPQLEKIFKEPESRFSCISRSFRSNPLPGMTAVN
ncbi:MAG TPA: hypothetical protein C5S50_03530 [Methanosarcinaceae archaeon]|nr:hypothetical protein [Methanosarcinaceae archaeon]